MPLSPAYVRIENPVQWLADIPHSDLAYMLLNSSLLIQLVQVPDIHLWSIDIQDDPNTCYGTRFSLGFRKQQEPERVGCSPSRAAYAGRAPTSASVSIVLFPSQLLSSYIADDVFHCLRQSATHSPPLFSMSLAHATRTILSRKRVR